MAEKLKITDEDMDLGLLQEVPLSFCKGNLVLPIRKENGTLIGAVSGQGGLLALRELSSHLGLTPKPERLEEKELVELINKFYGQMGSAQDVMGNISGEDISSVATEFEKPRDILELTEEAPIIRLLNAVLQQAVKERASDIHIEPYEKDIEVRIRVDGILRNVLSPPKIIQDALVSRVKIMARLDIAEKRLPQDGRIRLLIGGRDIDIRVSIVPTVYGERTVMRLLDRQQGVISLGEIGLSEEGQKTLESMLNRSNGIVLVTGPTGSGKTTTLYAGLHRIHSGDKNIITVEDPVEYQLAGVGQINVNSKVGLSFASGLRSILRQDPDVIMVGEIRDRETAEIAIQASLTGHLVLSTLHTNDAPSAIARLLDMGVEPFLAASSITGVMAQRLLRRVCSNCKEEYDPSEAEAAYFETRPAHLWRGKGCARCNNTGYLGRIGVYEMLNITDEIRELVGQKADAQKIRASAIAKGMKTLRDDGLKKTMAGVTTLAEVLRVTQTEGAETQ